MRPRSVRYAESIRNIGAQLVMCVRFMDGTDMFIAHPKSELQRAACNRHKRRYALKFPAVSTPDVFIFNVYGPQECHRHDMNLFRHFNLNNCLRQGLVLDDFQYCIYGDLACVSRSYLIVPL